MEDVLADSMPVRLRRPARLLRLASDERLVALVRAGDEGAFEALYDRHHGAILGFCRHMLGTREEAEDALQHTFLSAFRDLARSDKPIELRPWLFAIARNRCLSLLRARRPHVAIEAVEPATDGLAATVEQREDLRELLADLSRLPEDQRAALLLAELGALDHAGIATVLGCPREKVKALVFQARTSLAASREARTTPCDAIRQELATASGAALRRGPLRRHIRMCEGCRAFKTEVATQRKLLALALPVVPTMALKTSVLGGGGAAAGGGTAAAASAAAGATSGAAGGSFGGVLGTVASTGAGKVAMSIVVAGAVTSGGALVERTAERQAAPPPRSGMAPASNGALALPFATGAPAAVAPATTSRPRSATASPPAVSPRSAPAEAPGTSVGAPPLPSTSHEPRPQHSDGGGGPVETGHPALSPATPARPPQVSPGAGDGARGVGPAPPAQGRAPQTPPGQTPAPAPAPSQPPSPAPPASDRVPPGAGGRPDGTPPAPRPAGGAPPKPGASSGKSQQASPAGTHRQADASAGRPSEAGAPGKPSKAGNASPPASPGKPPHAGAPGGTPAQGPAPGQSPQAGPPAGNSSPAASPGKPSHADTPAQGGAAPPAAQAPPAGAGSPGQQPPSLTAPGAGPSAPASGANGPGPSGGQRSGAGGSSRGRGR